MKTIVIILMVLPTSVLADINYFRVAANTTLVIDMLQTVEISKNDSFYETNDILGRYPDEREVYTYFAGVILLTNVIGEVLPDPYGDYFYLSVAVVQTNQIAENYMVGVRISF